MHTHTTGGRRRGLLAIGAVIPLLLAACGGTSTATGGTAATSAPPAASGSAAPAESATSAGAAAPSDAGYTGPPAAITYSIWGDPQEITSQKAIADAFTAAN